MPQREVSYKFLVIDDVDLLEVNNLRRRVNQATKHPEPIFRLNAPWDKKTDWFNYLNVLYDEELGRFRMWYQVLGYNPLDYTYNGGRRTFYAESTNGINWERPILNRVSINGSTENNCLIPEMVSLAYTIIQDPSDIPARRYKMIFFVDSVEMRWAGFHVPLCLAYSHDGFEWTRPRHVNPILRGVSDGGWGFFYDTDRRKYVLLTRRVPNLPRDISQYESYDLVNWEDKGRVLVPGDEHDPPDMFNFQGMTPFRYDDTFHLGLLNTQYSLPASESYECFHKSPEGYPNDRLGTVDVQLAYTRDGKRWHRPDDRSPVIPVGEPGSHDEGTIFVPSSNPIVRNGETWIFYMSHRNRHSAWSQNEVSASVGHDARKMGFGMLAKMPEDGWVSLDAGDEEGSLLCKPWGPQYNILVNADIEEGGYVLAEVTTPFGEVVKGFAREDCIPATGCGPGQAIRWKGDRRPSEVTGAHAGGVCLRLFLKRAKLFSYTFSLMASEAEASQLERDKINARWHEVIKHRSDNWGKLNTEEAGGLPPVVEKSIHR